MERIATKDKATGSYNNDIKIAYNENGKIKSITINKEKYTDITVTTKNNTTIIKNKSTGKKLLAITKNDDGTTNYNKYDSEGKIKTKIVLDKNQKPSYSIDYKNGAATQKTYYSTNRVREYHKTVNGKSYSLDYNYTNGKKELYSKQTYKVVNGKSTLDKKTYYKNGKEVTNSSITSAVQNVAAAATSNVTNNNTQNEASTDSVPTEKSSNPIGNLINDIGDGISNLFDNIGDGLSNIYEGAEDLIFTPIEDKVLEGKDGKIGDTDQQTLGDCWLLSGVNALSYTKEGKKVIKEALEYKDNGDVVVHFKGLDSSYTITETEQREVIRNKAKGDGEYAKGDIDMKIFELAIEKAYTDQKNANFIYIKDTPFPCENAEDLKEDLEEDGSVIWGGFSAAAMYLITGKKTYREKDKEKMSKLLDNFDKSSVALAASCSQKITVKDAYGKKVKLTGPHAYAIQIVSDDKVYVVNPWDTTKEIVLTKETFLKTFAGLDVCELNSQNVNYIKKPNFTDVNGNKIYYFYNKENKKTTVEIYNKSGKIKYTDEYDSSYTRSYVCDKNGNVTGLKERDSNNNITKDYEYNYSIIGRLKEIIEYTNVNTNYHYINNQNDEIKPIKEYKVYTADGELKYTGYIDENYMTLSKKEYDTNKNGKEYIKSTTAYYNNCQKQIIFYYDETGDIKKGNLATCSIQEAVLNDYHDIPKNFEIKINKQECENIIKRNLMTYSQFDINEIKNLAQLSNDEWKIAQKVLNQNKNATYEEIAQYTTALNALNIFKNTFNKISNIFN